MTLNQPTMYYTYIASNVQYCIINNYVFHFSVPDTIYMFHPELEDWVLSPQRLDMPRRDFAAFFVPDDYFECV